MTSSMFKGLIIRESLQDASVLDELTITKEETWDIDEPGEGQSSVWHVVTVEVESDKMNEVAQTLSHALDEGKWFVDFSDGQTIVVVFRERVFQYQKGDTATRDEAMVFGRQLGIPEKQLAWEA